MENDNFPIISTLSLSRYVMHLPRTGDVISSSSSSNQLTAQLLSDFLILFPKDFQNLVWGKKKAKAKLKHLTRPL